MSDFTGKTVLITGTASGIGLACALWFVERGAKVWGFDFDPLEDSTRRLTALGVRLTQGDVRREADVQRWIEAAVADAGKVDVLVNSAGVSAEGRITDISEETYDRCLDTNLKGAFLCCKHVIAAMAKSGGGAIVNIASNAGVLPRAHDPVYCISKAGLIMLTRALALTHASELIRLNAVCPGPVADTRMMDGDIQAYPNPEARRREVIEASPMSATLGRMATTAEVAEAVGYLASDAALMVTGTVLQIDGGKALGVPPKKRS